MTRLEIAPAREVSARPAPALGWLVMPWACALLAFMPVVAGPALLLWVGGGALVAFVATLICLSRTSAWLAWLVGAVVTVVWAYAAEVLAGTQSGPVTRSSFLAAGLTVGAAVLWSSRRPTALLIPTTALVAAATALAPGIAALPWVSLYVVVAGLVLVLTGPYAARDLAQRRRAWAVALLLLMVAAATIIGASLAAWTLAAGTQTQDSTAIIGPFPTPDPTPTIAPTPTVDPTTAPTPTPEPTSATGNSATDAITEVVRDAVTWATYLLLLLLFLLAAILVYRLLIALRRRLAWSLTRRRLRRGTAPSRVAGAWTWARLQLVRGGWPWAASASPDVVAMTHSAAAGLPAEDALRDLARLAVNVDYPAVSPLSDADAARAWALADEVARASRPTTRRRRWSAAKVTPQHAQQRLPEFSGR